MSAANEHHVYLSVTGFDDASEVSRILQIEPSKAWARGDPMPNSAGVRRFSRWMLQSKLPLSDAVEAHLRDLLPLLEQRREAVAEVSRQFQVHLAVAVYCHAHNPILYLKCDLVERIASLAIDLDFDVYCLFEDQ